MQEAEFSKTGDKRLCPVLFSLPGGFLVVMPRTWRWVGPHFYAKGLVEGLYKDLPVEPKASSFGWLWKGWDYQLVAVDYGG